MINTDVFPIIVKIVKYCMVLFAVVEFAKGFVSEAESRDLADRDVNIESSEQCADFHRKKPQSQLSAEEESSSVLATVEERKAKCREIIRAASKRRWQQSARGRREIRMRRMMMVEKRLAAIKMIITDVFWALSFVLYYTFGLVGLAITQALSSLVPFQSNGIRLENENSEQCTCVYRKKTQSSTEEESSSVLTTVKERRAKCRKVVLVTAKRQRGTKKRYQMETKLHAIRYPQPCSVKHHVKLGLGGW